MQFPQVMWRAVVILVLLQGCASVKAKNVRRLDDRNEAALSELKAGQSRQAQETLIAALSEAEKQKVQDDPAVARTHMNLGVVYATGLNQRGRAVRHMVQALKLSPKEVPPSAFAGDAKVQKAFAVAQRRSGGAGEAEPAPPPPVQAIPASTPEVEAAPQVATTTARSGKARARKGRRGANHQREAVAAEAPSAAEPPPPEVAASTPAAPTTTAEPAAASPQEASLPRPLPEQVYCPVPDEVPPGQDVVVWCGVEPSLRVRAATLFVRPRGQPEFEALEFSPTPNGWWTATVPARLVKEGLVQYYVEAGKTGAEPAAKSADAYSPNLLFVKRGARRAPPVLTQAVLDGEDDPTQDLGPAVEEPLEPAPAAGFDWHHLWVGLQVGAGWGWHGKAALEFRQDIEVESGTASARLLHVLPEIGYRLNDRWSVSLQTRHQFFPTQGNTGGRPGGPARGANSALLRALYHWDITTRLHGLASAALGGGEGFRFVLPPVASRGRSGTDTVRGGPILVGAGVGGLFDVTQRFGVTAELRALLGVPDVGVLGELNLGLRYSFQ